MAVFEDECQFAGLNQVEVGRIANRLARAARDAQKLGLIVFGGSGNGTLRSVRHDDHQSRPLVVADIDGGSWSGGDGGCGFADDGLMRGEGL